MSGRPAISGRRRGAHRLPTRPRRQAGGRYASWPRSPCRLGRQRPPAARSRLCRCAYVPTAARCRSPNSAPSTRAPPCARPPGPGARQCVCEPAGLGSPGHGTARSTAQRSGGLGSWQTASGGTRLAPGGPSNSRVLIAGSMEPAAKIGPHGRIRPRQAAHRRPVRGGHATPRSEAADTASRCRHCFRQALFSAHWPLAGGGSAGGGSEQFACREGGPQRGWQTARPAAGRWCTRAHMRRTTEKTAGRASTTYSDLLQVAIPPRPAPQRVCGAVGAAAACLLTSAARGGAQAARASLQHDDSTACESLAH